MKTAIVIVLVCVGIGGAMWGYTAWQSHRAATAAAAQDAASLKAAQAAITPFKDSGAPLTNPFPVTGITP